MLVRCSLKTLGFPGGLDSAQPDIRHHHWVSVELISNFWGCSISPAKRNIFLGVARGAFSVFWILCCREIWDSIQDMEEQIWNSHNIITRKKKIHPRNIRKFKPPTVMGLTMFNIIFMHLPQVTTEPMALASPPSQSLVQWGLMMGSGDWMGLDGPQALPNSTLPQFSG